MKRIFIISLIVIAAIGLIAGMVVLSKNNKPGKIDPPQIKEASVALARGDLLSAKAIYKKAMEDLDDADKLKELQKQVEDINIKILFSPTIDACSVKYVVKPGDTLAKISKDFNTPIGLIKRSNALASDVIHPGQEFKIATCKFSIAVDKSQNLLFLKVRDEVIKTYIVSTGKNNSTPVGTFKIINKLTNPTWFKTGAVIPPNSTENILGTRWLGFNLKGYGIHGTTAPQELGQQVTLGCVRMKNEEVEELYDIVPEGTEVTIVD
ncbi:MAG: L,D-transpeptidase family protein [Candidatus Omnitrophica bacterium]|nr:L,D-transpeptidase family protein [Candidatus Omnitrophota bacterium]